MKNPGFIGVEAVRDTYLPLGFSNFKIEGRGLGSALLLAADTLAKTAASTELPVSIFTSLLGVPFLLYLILRPGRDAS